MSMPRFWLSNSSLNADRHELKDNSRNQIEKHRKLRGRTCLDANSGKVRLPKTHRVPEAFAGRELTERSLKIIETVGRYRFLSSSRIIRLVGGNEDVTHRHLQQLFHRGLISRLKIPSAPANSEFVYFLENAALLKSVARDTRINAEYLNFDEIRLNRDKYGGEDATKGRQRTGQMLFIEHE